MADVLPEGRYFLNPFFWSYELQPMIEVPAGKVLVMTRMYGKPIPPERLAAGDFLAEDDERGIVAEVLRPGKYRINPYAYTWKLEDAVEVGAGEVGVLTLKVGKDPAELPADPKRGPYVVPDGYRGVQEKPLSSGTYYVNPYVKKIAAVDTRSHQAEFTDIEFPSKDGFHIKPHVMVTYRVLESKAPELFVTLSDDAELPLGDRTPQEIEKNPVLQKAVLPLIRGYARIEGSKMAGRDFVAQSATRRGRCSGRQPARGAATEVDGQGGPGLRRVGRRRRVGHRRPEREGRRPGGAGDADRRPRAGPAGA